MVTLIVASSTGGMMGDALRPHSIRLATITTAVSFVALTIGLTLALMIITVYLTRLVLHGPPDVGLILSSFIVLGPLGQGGFSLLVNGQNLSNLLPAEEFPFAGQILYAACFCGAWILWSMGISWVVIAFISVYAVLRKEKIPFTLSYWGIIFPNGVFALLSVQLGVVLDSSFFHYFGAIWTSKCRPLTTFYLYSLCFDSHHFRALGHRDHQNYSRGLGQDDIRCPLPRHPCTRSRENASNSFFKPLYRVA